jgi:hypothetical protein
MSMSRRLGILVMGGLILAMLGGIGLILLLQAGSNRALRSLSAQRILDLMPQEDRARYEADVHAICAAYDPRDDGTWDSNAGHRVMRVFDDLLDRRHDALLQDVIPTQQFIIVLSDSQGPSFAKITTTSTVVMGYDDHRDWRWIKLRDEDGTVRVTQENLEEVLTTAYRQQNTPPP